jgi:hypothetical protein
MRCSVTGAFNQLISPLVLGAVNKYPPPSIAVHVRRGDFRDLMAGENFAEVGGVRTPLQYFATIIANLRSCAGWPVPVILFSDGSNSEVRALLSIENVHSAPAMPDVGHLALMSRAKVIVASAGSTFSMWAGFCQMRP